MPEVSRDERRLELVRQEIERLLAERPDGELAYPYGYREMVELETELIRRVAEARRSRVGQDPTG